MDTASLKIQLKWMTFKQQYHDMEQFIITRFSTNKQKRIVFDGRWSHDFTWNLAHFMSKVKSVAKQDEVIALSTESMI